MFDASNPIREEIIAENLMSYVEVLEHVLRYKFGLHIYQHPNTKNTGDFACIISSDKLDKTQVRNVIKANKLQA